MEFLRDPVRYLLNADEAQSDAIMREVESRQTDADSAELGELSILAAGSLAKATPDDGELKVADKPATARTPKAKKAKPRVEGQRELLLPIAGGKKAEAQSKTATVSNPRRKAGSV